MIVKIALTFTLSETSMYSLSAPQPSVSVERCGKAPLPWPREPALCLPVGLNAKRRDLRKGKPATLRSAYSTGGT